MIAKLEAFRLKAGNQIRWLPASIIDRQKFDFDLRFVNLSVFIEVYDSSFRA